MAFTWLHISDFHVRIGDPYERDVVLKALVRSAADYRAKGRVPDVIFATGDIAFSGKAREYEIAERFFNDLLKALQLPKQRLWVIPGNHDVDREQGEGLVRTLGSRDEANRYFSPEGPKPHLTQKMRAYLDWHNKYFEGVRTAPEASTCGPVEALTLNGVKVGVLPINSALFCKGDDDHGKLWVGRRCLDEAISEVKGLNAALHVILMHHPLDFLHSQESGNIQAALEGLGHVMLRGHLHTTRIETVSSGDGELLRLAAGAAYATQESPLCAMYGEMDRDMVTIYPIRYEDSPTEKWTHDTSTFPEDEEKSFRVRRSGVGEYRPVRASLSAIWNLEGLQKAEERLEGRFEEMDRLMAAWREPHGRVVAIEGPGGTGKTALIRAFLQHLKLLETMLQPEKVYGSTFQNQGQEDFQSTAIGIVREALKFFGCPPDGPRPFTDLIQYLREHRCVLVLDGIETQPRDENGNLMQHNNEEGLRSFFQELCDNDLPKGGLVLITSTERVKEVKPQTSNTEVISLTGLRDEEGAAILEGLGPPKELKRASHELKGNALALVILGAFLRVHGLNIFQRGLIQLPKTGDQALVVERVIKFYADQLSQDEQKFLRLLGLFGRPMNQEDLDGLQKNKPCSAVEFLSTYTPHAREALIQRLRALHLINAPDHKGLQEVWDTHPLIRQHFAEELRKNFEEEWREAHGKLFDLYSSGGQEDSLDSDKVLDLFGAVRHGCLASRHSDAYNLYRSRIAGEFHGYDTENSPFAPEALLALSAFFEDGAYTDPVSALDQYERAWLLARVSYCLHSLGNLAGAVKPRVASNRIYGELRDAQWAKVRYEASRDAAYGAEMLSQIYKRLGVLGKAIAAAREAVTLAAASENDESEARKDVRWNEDYQEEPVPGWLRRCSTEAALGAALHRQGKVDEADKVFRYAMERHDLECPRDRRYSHCFEFTQPALHSEPGVWCALFKLDMAKNADDLDVLQTLSDRMQIWSAQAQSKSSVPISGLHWMVRGMVQTELADFLRERKPERRQVLRRAVEDLTQALLLMRDSSKYHFLCDVLVARARTARILQHVEQAKANQHLEQAKADLKEAREISERCGMRLTLVDTLILQGHLYLDERQDHAEEMVSRVVMKANALIEETQYLIAEPALRLLEWRLSRYTNKRGVDITARIEARKSLEKVPIPRLIRQFKRFERQDWKP